MVPETELSMSHLRRVANAFTESPWARTRGIGLPTLGTYAASDCLYFTRLATWRQDKPDKDRVLVFLSNHWPEGSQWPPDIPRPEYPQTLMSESLLSDRERHAVPQASPGPWRYNPCKPAANIVDADGTTMGVVTTRATGCVLLLAAPDLLAALEALVCLDIKIPFGHKRLLRLPDNIRWWTVPGDSNRTAVRQIYRSALVASVSRWADARLIAAAPDLRAVLGVLHDLYTDGELTAARSDRRRLTAAMRQAGTAIAKAQWRARKCLSLAGAS